MYIRYIVVMIEIFACTAPAKLTITWKNHWSATLMFVQSGCI